MYSRLWSFRTARFRVELGVQDETYPDLSWDETGETQTKVANGEWGCFDFRVRVLLDGREIARDAIGNSVYADPREFWEEHFGIAALRRKTGRNVGCYFSDMVRQAIADARKAGEVA